MGGSSKPGAVKTEINVTPLVDVVLVLLIIFLVTMPTVMRTVTLEVPRKAEQFETLSDPSKPILVCRLPNNAIRFDPGTGDSTKIEAGGLADALRPVLESRRARASDERVFIDFHPKVQWQDVVDTIDRVRSLGEDNTTDPTKRYEQVKIALRKRDVNDAEGSGTPNGKDDYEACGCQDDLGETCDPKLNLGEE
jgi:biopolymer transport protein ExbD/biopolymer transport protein TolR